MNRLSFLIVVACIIIFSACENKEIKIIDLSGTWAYKLDTSNIGEQEEWFAEQFEDTLHLPGSLQQNGIGFVPSLETQWTASIYDSSWYFAPNMERYRSGDRPLFPFILTPKLRYVGAAWYQKEITIPHSWNGKSVALFLERAHWETTVWLDGVPLGSQNSLVSAHRYALGNELTEGKHWLIVRVDNSVKDVDVGQDSHSISDHTQGNWNGIVGKMELQARELIHINAVQVYPDIDQQRATLRLTIDNESKQENEITILASAKSYNGSVSHQPESIKVQQVILPGVNTLELPYEMGEQTLLWDEIDPNLYQLDLQLVQDDQVIDETSTSFGMRKFEARGTQFFVNDRQIFLRGNCDCAIFPLTGFPPTNLEYWLSYFEKLKAYGFNHVRFHSWCPPKAAFDAADQIGFFLQPEGPSWANHGVSLGDGLPIDQYIYDETNRIMEDYGNHPSYCLLAYGNEPRGRHQAEYLNEFVTYWKQKDARRLYTGASVGKSWPYVDSAEFIVKSYPRGVPVEQQPNSLFDYRRFIDAQQVPYVSHEIGQYCAYPNFDEIEKYTGVFQARNFELFRDLLKQKGMADQSQDFLMSSGKLQSIFYKAEIEAALRTPGFGGFQMLQLNDFPGQGTALVGVLDAFFDEKGYIDEEEFTRFNDKTVLLARLPKYTFTNVEQFTAKLEISHFGKESLKDQSLVWEIVNSEEQVLFEGKIAVENIPIGNGQEIGAIAQALESITQATELQLKVRLEHTAISNSWRFWVYPDEITLPETEDLIVTDEFSPAVIDQLEKGGKVLLLAAGKVENGKDVEMHFKPVFWNTSWFKMRPPHTLGHLVLEDHPALAQFPTNTHSDFQWWELVHKQQVMNLDLFPEGFQPIVQPIDTWFINRKLGLLFEAKVGKGKLLVCSADITTDLENRIAARQFYYSLLAYAKSENFEPTQAVESAIIAELFEQKERNGYDTFSKANPDELMPKAK